jgi:hypothetical protein
MAIRRKAPPCRRLRAFTFDPSLSLDLDRAVVNQTVLCVPWEDLEAGPVGEYLEVIDRDPASDCFYLPVDLNDPVLLAQDGLAPSEGDPQFHQQMVYAVVMTTIRNFETALGRRVLWSPRRVEGRGGADGRREETFVERLRCYPHALRGENAYYSPEKKALLFGYFRTTAKATGEMLPGGVVFTCLSHDIVAHEATHAILDGVHRRFVEPSNRDVLAFHEAFADIVALFQHFTFPEALRHQIAMTKGDLGRENLLGQLAAEFGNAMGSRTGLRSAIGRRHDRLTAHHTEPHERGAILVAAVFDAFVTVYKARIADLLRMATGQGARFPEDDLHPDLVERLVGEANKAAGHVLKMCIRALDYCPPVDLTFGEYLRALITADADLSPLDQRDYRLAMIAAFRERQIFPDECRSLSVGSLLWRAPTTITRLPELDKMEVKIAPDRRQSYERSQRNQGRMHGILDELLQDFPGERGVKVEQELGLALDPGTAPGTIRRKENGRCVFEVHSVRVARRILPDGSPRADLVIEVTQRRRGYLDPRVQARADKELPWDAQPPPDFWFRGGCTLIVDAADGEVRYAVRKRVQSNARLDAQRKFLAGSVSEGLAATYFGHGNALASREPFAFLHSGH